VELKAPTQNVHAVEGSPWGYGYLGAIYPGRRTWNDKGTHPSATPRKFLPGCSPFPYLIALRDLTALQAVLLRDEEAAIVLGDNLYRRCYA